MLGYCATPVRRCGSPRESSRSAATFRFSGPPAPSPEAARYASRAGDGRAEQRCLRCLRRDVFGSGGSGRPPSALPKRHPHKRPRR